jgi:hypothetical protein
MDVYSTLPLTNRLFEFMRIQAKDPQNEGGISTQFRINVFLEYYSLKDILD